MGPISKKVIAGLKKAKNKKIINFQELKEAKARTHDELKALMTVEEQMTGKIKKFATKRDEAYKKTVTIEIRCNCICVITNSSGEIR